MRRPQHDLPHVVELEDIRGDVHMHTTASDGHNSIREMAEAALACGYKYIAITDHSKNLAMTNGLDEKRALEQIKQVREVDKGWRGASACSPASRWTFWPTARSTWTTKCWRRWTS